jgi:YcxB-like protein
LLQLPFGAGAGAAERDVRRTKDRHLKIEYELKPEDWGEFAVYVASQSQSLRRSKWTLRLLVSGSLLIFAVDRARAHDSISAAVIAILAVALWLSVPHMIFGNVRQHAMNRDRPCLRGRHSLEIVQEGIRATCDVSNSLHQWAGIRSIVSTSTHVFVLIGQSLGYTVPRAGIVEGNLDAFVESARVHCNR